MSQGNVPISTRDIQRKDHSSREDNSIQGGRFRQFDCDIFSMITEHITVLQLIPQEKTMVAAASYIMPSCNLHDIRPFCLTDLKALVGKGVESLNLQIWE